MDEVEVSTIVYVPPPEIYAFLADFPLYANYSKHLTEVRTEGDGSPGTEYYITFSWWKLSYTAHAEVTAVDPPTRIDWRLVEDVDAEGYWGIEAAPDEAPDDETPATRVRLHVRFHPDSADSNTLRLPRFVSLDWVIGKVKPMIRKEAERIVERIVADLEEEPRDVEVTVHTSPDSV